MYAENDFVSADSRLGNFERLHLRANCLFEESVKSMDSTAKPAQKCGFNVTTIFARRFL
jgi:hypothetical protein